MKKRTLSWLLAINLLAAGAAQASCEVYEDVNFEGGYLVLEPNQDHPVLGPEWDNIISSVRVSNHCRLLGFEHEGYEGVRYIFNKNFANIGRRANDSISSLQCQCPDE